jgi:hypothetical protein
MDAGCWALNGPKWVVALGRSELRNNPGLRWEVCSFPRAAITEDQELGGF